MATAALALLVAQGVSAVLLLRAAQDRRETVMLNTAAFHLLTGEATMDGRADRQAMRRAFRDGPGRRLRGGDETVSLTGQGRGRDRLPPRLRYRTEAAAPIAARERRDETEFDLRIEDMLEERGFTVARIATTMRDTTDDPLLRVAMERRPRLARRLTDRRVLVAAIQREEDGVWHTARVLEPRRDSRAVAMLLGQTALIFVLLLGLLWLVLSRITRPLAALTARVERFDAARPDTTPLLADGPSDIARLITAHNAMEARIAGLLEEKDVMLGAIGHDLKTPLAALRVRIETVEDEGERAKMAAGIEDITRSLDDILSLARIGRDATPAERTNFAALVESVVEEYEDRAMPVTLVVPERIVATVHVTWLRRALRNLISNAVRYGGAARVAMLADGDDVVLRVDDDGPGIPADRIADMLEPFTRGEASRNRTTGGAGLGLTLARAIAQQHGGTLVLANRADQSDGGGLRAELRLPLDKGAAPR